MLWHIAGGTAVVSILNWRRIGAWLQERAGLQSSRSIGFVFATIFAVFAAPLALNLGQPVPRFNDVFLVGVVLTAYLFCWEPAAYLLALSVLISAWVLPPNGTLRVVGFGEWYRLASFTAVSVFLVMLISRMKTRHAGAVPDSSLGMGAASGD